MREAVEQESRKVGGPTKTLAAWLAGFERTLEDQISKENDDAILRKINLQLIVNADYAWYDAAIIAAVSERPESRARHRHNSLACLQQFQCWKSSKATADYIVRSALHLPEGSVAHSYT